MERTVFVFMGVMVQKKHNVMHLYEAISIVCRSDSKPKAVNYMWMLQPFYIKVIWIPSENSNHCKREAINTNWY